MALTVVLDTGVFFVPEALERLAELPHDVIVPAVVFTERARQLSRQGVGVDGWLDAVEVNAFEIEAYGVDQARRWAPEIHDDEEWRRLARDAMIAGHLGEDRVLWTTNLADFQEIGLSDDRIAAIDTPDAS
jgi:predicted nucleic acid-binding protein